LPLRLQSTPRTGGGSALGVRRQSHINRKQNMKKTSKIGLENKIKNQIEKIIPKTLLVCFLVILSAGCASLPKYSEASSKFPEIPTGDGRIYLYMNDGFWNSGPKQKIWLNDEALGTLVIKHFFYVDRPAGNYSVKTKKGLVDFDESKIMLTFTLAAGETKYLRIEDHANAGFWWTTTAELEDKDTAIKALLECDYGN
jgi:hypothetical protein